MSTPAAARRGTKPAEVRRAEILAAAVGLFHANGYDATSVQQIAAAAGMATGTVYLYFPSKEHVLRALHADFHAGVEAEMQQAFDTVWQQVDSGESTVEAPLELMVGSMVDAVVRYIRSHPHETTVMYRYVPRHDDVVGDDEHSSGYIAAAIEFGVAEGKVHVSDPQMAGLLLEASLSEPLMRMVVAGDNAEVDRLAAQAKEFFAKALAPQADPSA